AAPPFSSTSLAVVRAPARCGATVEDRQSGTSGSTALEATRPLPRSRATLSVMTTPLLVRAARREQVERTPVWFMRQAGRSLPEYRAIRERHSFFEVAGTPELCAEVTLQPVRRHGVDAAVLFADIVSPVIGMGIGVELVEGVGPVVDRPIGSRADVERLSLTEPDPRIL